jgi:hypothetical protein
MDTQEWNINPSYTVNHLLIIYIDPQDANCRACNRKLSLHEIELRRCRDCQCFLALPGETIIDIYKQRKLMHRPHYELMPEHIKKPVIFWHLGRGLPSAVS